MVRFRIKLYLPACGKCILASPDKTSKAARDTLRSVFHDDIKRWQIRYVALRNKAWVESRNIYKEIIIELINNKRWISFSYLKENTDIIQISILNFKCYTKNIFVAFYENQIVFIY